MPSIFKKLSKEFNKEFPKNSQKIPKSVPKNSPKIPKKFKNSQKIPGFRKFPTSHLQAENPFGLVNHIGKYMHNQFNYVLLFFSTEMDGNETSIFSE